MLLMIAIAASTTVARRMLRSILHSPPVAPGGSAMRHVLDEWACSSCLLSSRTVDREPRHDEECAAGRRPHESMSDLRCFTLQRDELRASATSDRHELFRIALVADDLCEWLAASAPRVRTRILGRNGPADHDDLTRGPLGGGSREPPCLRFPRVPPQ